MKRKVPNPPATVFKMYNSKKVHSFEPYMDALLFWPCKERIKVNDEGLIRFSFNDESYAYQIVETERFWTKKNDWIMVCFNPEDISKAYLFETLNEDYIGEIAPRMVLNKENKKEILAMQRQLRNKLTAYARKAKKEDENLSEGLPADYHVETPDLDAEILKRDIEEMLRRHKENLKTKA
jgi:hypothetical protein